MCKPYRVSNTAFRSSLTGALALSAAAFSISIPAAARDRYVGEIPPATAEKPTPQGPALMTLVSLNKQRLYVYGADGMITTSRVSTGTRGNDTPIGIYSVIQKKVDHASNLYNGAPMPHMQRLLWSGIAMHGGAVPRYPASHGCIRLPWDFAETFFGMTSLSHRVVVTPNVRAPVRFNHPLLFRPLPETDPEPEGLGLTMLGPDFMDVKPVTRTMSIVAAERAAEYERLAEADTAAKEALAKAQSIVEDSKQRLVVARARFITARPELKRLEAIADKAEGTAAAAERRLKDRAKSLTAKAGRMRADVLDRLRQAEAAEWARIAPLRERANAATADLKSFRSAIDGYGRLLADAELHSIEVRRALERSAGVEAVAARVVEDFRRAERHRARPIAIFISSRTSRISLRQGQEPVGEGQIEIEDSHRPLGTYIFTATGWRDESRKELAWTMVSVDERGEVSNPSGTNRDAQLPLQPSDPLKAQLALDRIRIPAEIVSRIGEVVKPGSSLIVSDYDMARSEVGAGTDFIVQMPEVVAKYRTPSDIAKAKSKRNISRSRTPWYTSGRTAPIRTVWVSPPKRVTARQGRGLYRTSIPSYFGYGYYE